MNRRQSSTLKGMFITPLVVTLLCLVVYWVSLAYPGSFPQSLAVRLILIMPPCGIVIGGLAGWLISELTRQERVEVATSSIAFLAMLMLSNVVWDSTIGSPQDEETKFLKQLLTTIVSAIAWTACLVAVKRRRS